MTGVLPTGSQGARLLRYALFMKGAYSCKGHIGKLRHIVCSHQVIYWQVMPYSQGARFIRIVYSQQVNSSQVILYIQRATLIRYTC